MFLSFGLYLTIYLCTFPAHEGIVVQAHTDGEKESLVSASERAHVYIHVTACQFKYHRIEGVCVRQCAERPEPLHALRGPWQQEIAALS